MVRCLLQRRPLLRYSFRHDEYNYGCARCPTRKQDLAAQQEALLKLGVVADRIYTDRGFTGTNRARRAYLLPLSHSRISTRLELLKRLRTLTSQALIPRLDGDLKSRHLQREKPGRGDKNRPRQSLKRPRRRGCPGPWREPRTMRTSTRQSPTGTISVTRLSRQE